MPEQQVSAIMWADAQRWGNAGAVQVFWQSADPGRGRLPLVWKVANLFGCICCGVTPLQPDI